MRSYAREEAERQFDELIDALYLEGPFSVQVDGKDAAIFLSPAHYEALLRTEQPAPPPPHKEANSSTD